MALPFMATTGILRDQLRLKFRRSTALSLTAYIANGLYGCGLYSYALHSRRLYSYGPHSNGLYIYGLYSYGPYSA